MAKVHSLLYIIYNIVLGFILFTVEELAFLGLVLILVGIFGTPIFAFFLYGFGEIIDMFEYAKRVYDTKHTNKKE